MSMNSAFSITATPRTDEFCTIGRMNLLVDYRIDGQLYWSTVGQDIYDRPPNTNLWKTVGQEIYDRPPNH